MNFPLTNVSSRRTERFVGAGRAVEATPWWAGLADHGRAIAWTILASSLICTAVAWKLSNRYLQRQASERFALRSAEVGEAILARMEAYQHFLRTGVAIHVADPHITRAQFKTFVDQQELQTHYPGIQGFGLSRLIEPQDREAFVDRLRQEGSPDFAIHPPGQRPIYSAITMLVPLDWRNRRALGFDMYNEPVRREAMDRAIATGQPAVSGRVRLVQETDVDVQAGFLVYLPLYRPGQPVQTAEQRQAAADRFIYAPFRTGDLVGGILRTKRPDIHFAIYDQTIASEHLLYASDLDAISTARQDRMFYDQQHLRVGGRTWVLQLAADSSFINPLEKSASLGVAMGGVLVDGLLFLIVGSLGRRQQRAQQLAERMTHTIRGQVEELRRINGELDDFAYIASHDLRSPLRNIRHLADWAIEDAGSHIPPDVKGHLDTLQDRVAIMDRLLTDLLQYSRVARADEPIKAVDGEILIQDVIASIGPPETMTIVRTGALPMLHTAGRPLATCLHHLIANAVQHHDRADGCVEIRCQSQGNRLRIEIRDDGPGIDPKFHQRIFKVFQTLQPSGGEDRSTGIGLAIVKKAAESYGGTIEVQSAVGRGSTFTLTWPTQMTTDPATPEPALMG